MAQHQDWAVPADSERGNGAAFQNHRTVEQERERALYRSLVGLDGPHPQLTTVIGRYLCLPLGSTRKAGVKGVYHLVCDEVVYSNAHFHFTSWFVNVLLALQIVIAAAITALGGATGTVRATTIVVLGAMNTVVAATLTFLKGKGLPSAALHYRNRMQRQKLQIENIARLLDDGPAAEAEGICAKKAAAKAVTDFLKAQSGFDDQMASLTSGRGVFEDENNPEPGARSARQSFGGANLAHRHYSYQAGDGHAPRHQPNPTDRPYAHSNLEVGPHETLEVHEVAPQGARRPPNSSAEVPSDLV